MSSFQDESCPFVPESLRTLLYLLSACLHLGLCSKGHFLGKFLLFLKIIISNMSRSSWNPSQIWILFLWSYCILFVLPLTEEHFKSRSVHYLSHLIKGMIKHLSMVLRSKWVQTCQTHCIRPASQELDMHVSTLSFLLKCTMGTLQIKTILCPLSTPQLPNSMLRQFVGDWVNVEVFLLKESSSHSPSLWKKQLGGGNGIAVEGMEIGQEEGIQNFLIFFYKPQKPTQANKHLSKDHLSLHVWNGLKIRGSRF